MRTLALCLLLLSGCAERKPEPRDATLLALNAHMDSLIAEQDRQIAAYRYAMRTDGWWDYMVTAPGDTIWLRRKVRRTSLRYARIPYIRLRAVSDSPWTVVIYRPDSLGPGHWGQR